jgi:hypothetical protein
VKLSDTKTSFISRSLDLLSKRIEAPTTTAQTKPLTLPEPWAQKLNERGQRRQEFLRKQTLKKAVAVIRLKSKTRRLVELCEQVMPRVRKSDAWFAKYERFFQSPVWKLVSDEAIRKAHFKCECWGCTKRAIRVYLLELPEEHIEPNFDWMKRDNILIALCGHHHEIIHGFVMKRIVPFDRQFDSALPGGDVETCHSRDLRPAVLCCPQPQLPANNWRGV